ncbi:MAG: tryptophan synthase subunit alpha [Candidatus Omnitrophica bacterium]|nr:tryptophan synthase subunit alpha [Candidatus Omnitrophota bacterium]
MDRIRDTFKRLSRMQRKALIPFVMAGDPDLAATEGLVTALAQAGADLVELGIPFSDPLADGPTIQRAAGRALAAGTTPQAVLACVGRLARRLETPLILLTYWNPVLQYAHATDATMRPLRQERSVPGARFAQAASQAGASGVIIPDLPPEEADGLRSIAHRLELATIFLASPTSPPDRLRRIARAAAGFIYYVSVTGTTGARDRLPADWLHGVRALKLITTKPVCVGFGISTPAQAARVGQVADGVIVGSALIKHLEPYLGSRRAMAQQAARFVRQLRGAL